ncbi:MAG: NRDE family protein, partial [Stenotrophomonas maltophilia]|nr:NRDE family protein [Stenotrophomonas maltophilia]
RGEPRAGGWLLQLSVRDTGIGLERERWLSPAFIRGDDYGTRASTVLLIDADGHGEIHERRFGPQGVALGQSQVDF